MLGVAAYSADIPLIGELITHYGYGAPQNLYFQISITDLPREPFFKIL